MKLRERLKEYRELGRAEGIFEERIRLIRKLHLDGHDVVFISDLMDENRDLIEKVIGMSESDPAMEDVAIAEVILSQADF